MLAHLFKLNFWHLHQSVFRHRFHLRGFEIIKSDFQLKFKEFYKTDCLEIAAIFIFVISWQIKQTKYLFGAFSLLFLLWHPKKDPDAKSGFDDRIISMI